MPNSVDQALRYTAPAVVLFVVAVADLSLQSVTSVASLMVIAPLVAAALVRPSLTAGYGVVAFALWAFLAYHDHQLSGALAHASLIRGSGMVVGVVIAVAAATARCRREARLRHVQQVAAVAQQAILHPTPDRLGSIGIAVHYRSSAQDATVGGDFYEVLDTPWGVRALIGDVRGKGLEAVRLAAGVLGAFREWSSLLPDLPDLLDRLNNAAQRQAASGDFVTAQLVQVSRDGMCTVVTAGHPPPVIVRVDHAELLPVPVTRPPLVFAGRAVEGRWQLHPADQLVLYTDGVTEARHRTTRTFFDDERLLGTVADGVTARHTVDTLAGAMDDWTGNRAADDLAVVAIQYLPMAAALGPASAEVLSAPPVAPIPQRKQPDPRAGGRRTAH